MFALPGRVLGGGRVAQPAAIKYRAFLSYSHRDKAWARWLHSALEGYRIDKDLVGRETSAGPVPKTLRPIFRDREDFSAGHSLTEQTLAALEASQFLIVICSPHAARSQYVNEEVRHFKAMGRADRIIPVVVAGDPGDPEQECFPLSLRFRVGPDGSLTNERQEPIAADVRPHGDGKEIAKQKVVAGLIGLGLDEIVRRAERTRRRATGSGEH
jgi:TIR domain